MPVDLTIPCFLLIALAVALGIGAGAIAGRLANDTNRGIVVVGTGVTVTLAFLALLVAWLMSRN